MEPTTLNRLFKEQFSQNAARPALGWKSGTEYEYLTYADLTALVNKFALGLMQLNVQPGDRVALLSENRYEWAVSDLAIQWAGAVTTPMFATLPARQVDYIVNDSGARVLIVSSKEQFAKAIEVKHAENSLERVIVMDEDVDIGSHVWAHRWKAVAATGEQHLLEISELERQRDAVQPDDLASIIYTSGTTGEPKGAMLTHNNFASNVIGASSALVLRSTDVFLSILPLAHVFERLAGHYLPLYLGALIGYTESLRTIRKNIQEVKPTIILGVPRIWEMFMEAILDHGKRLSGTERKAFDWGLRLAERMAKAKLYNHSFALGDSIQYAVADKVVLRKIRSNALGGRLRLGASGGAPLPHAVCEFFIGIGLPLCEGYGLTETSPVISVNRPPIPKVGTVGPLIDGVEVKIAEDGEILSRGPHIMKGYWNKPEETREAIDRDGWFHTGDIGTFVDGYLKITDRKKNILVLASGKNVAPALVENTLLRSRYISQVVVLGDKQKTVTALIVPNFAELKEWAPANEIDAASEEELAKEPKVNRLIRSEIDRLSADLADFERVRRFTLLPKEFSVAEDEMTPTLKIKRKVVEEKYRELISTMSD